MFAKECNPRDKMVDIYVHVNDVTTNKMTCELMGFQL